MTTVVLDWEAVTIPDEVKDLESFRHWVDSDEFPETGRICFLCGRVWIDMSKEQLFSHNQVKAEYTRVLHHLAKYVCRGLFFADGAYLTNLEADLSVQPYGCYVAYEALRRGQARLVEGAREGYLEVEGTPDMVLEIVSTSSVEKDTVSLRELYWRAGISEYWLVDARGDRPNFTMFRHGARGYVAVRKPGGWMKSEVFGKSFRLVRGKDELGHPEYTLEVR